MRGAGSPANSIHSGSTGENWGVDHRAGKLDHVPGGSIRAAYGDTRRSRSLDGRRDPLSAGAETAFAQLPALERRYPPLPQAVSLQGPHLAGPDEVHDTAVGCDNRRKGVEGRAVG